MARAGDEAAPGDPVEVALAARVAELGHGLQLRRPPPGAGPRRGEVDVVLTAAGALFHFLQTINKHGLFNYMDPRTHSSYALNIPCPSLQNKLCIKITRSVGCHVFLYKAIIP